MKSDIKNIDGSEDIIKAICDEEVINSVNYKGTVINFTFLQDDEANLAKSLETNCSHVYSKMLTLEKELNLLFAATNNNIINNNSTNESKY